MQMLYAGIFMGKSVFASHFLIVVKTFHSHKDKKNLGFK